MEPKKWCLVRGLVYRLDDVFDDPVQAVNRINILQQDKRVYLLRTGDGRWAVYWRPPEKEVACDPKMYSVVGKV